METLKNYIKESIDSNPEEIQLIQQFIEKNYVLSSGKYTIKKVKDKYIVSSRTDVFLRNKKLKHLTNNLFEWGNVKGFDCNSCDIDTLDGGPKTVFDNFNCSYCDSLKDLKGAPEKVGGKFECNDCSSLESLEGAPIEAKVSFNCSYCESLKSLEGAPKNTKYFICNDCTSLKSLEGAPEVCFVFNCERCGKKFTQDDVINVLNCRNTSIHC